MTTSDGQGSLLHTALIYRDPEQLRLTVGDFVRDGIDAGEPVLAVLPTHQLDALSDLLDGPGIDREDMAQVGRNPARVFPMLERWLADHAGTSAPGGRVRIISEPLWPGRSGPEVAECLRLEALLNVAFADAPASVLCPYDAEHLDAELIAGAERTHPRVIDGAGSRASAAYGDPAEVAKGGEWPQDPVPADASELGFTGDLSALRHAVLEQPHLAALSRERREDYVFAINEVTSNAVRHGDGTCEARMWRDGERIVTEVATSTAVLDPLAGLRHPPVDALGGRGLWLVNQLCDLVELRNLAHGSSVRMHIAG